MRSEGSPKMFFPTAKLIGSSRLLFGWLQASDGRKGVPKPAVTSLPARRGGKGVTTDLPDGAC